MNLSQCRLAVVLSHPTQYYSPWFRWLRQNTELNFRVFYLWDFGATFARDIQFGASFRWDTDLLSGYEWEMVPNVASDPGTHHFGGLRNPSLLARLKRWRPSALLVFGYNWSSMMRAIGWARLRGVRLIFRGDSHFIGRTRPNWRRGLALRLLYRQFDAFAYVGAANRRYFEALGVPPRRLYFSPHAVDASQFDAALPDLAEAAAELRQRLGATAATRVVLFAGKFLPAKQPRELLEAFALLAPSDAILVFAGDGEEKPALEQLAGRHPGARVRFLPFANQSEMPCRYLAADLMVLPSRGHYETWGLAVNEAMLLGTPCLVSDRVGCREDLITEGQTGWSFQVDDPLGLQTALGAALAALAEPGRRARLKASIAARIAQYGYSQAGAGLVAAVRSLT